MQKLKASKTIIALFVLSLIALSAAVYFFWQYQAIINKDGRKELAGYLTTISTFMELPKDETPTLATVADVAKLRSQSFFKNAQNGDKVIIYVKTQKAILYRPASKKIIEVAPINIQNEPGVTPTPAP